MINTTLGEKLRELRKINGYTQDYVASYLGLVRQTYSHYETGKRTPGSEVLYKLSGLYHISIQDLLQQTIEPDDTMDLIFPELTPSGEDLSGFLQFFNNPRNQKKYQLCTTLEKEMLYYFGQLSAEDKREMIEFTKIKARKHKK